MTTRQNRIATPPHLHIRIAITIDPNTNESAMKIERGKITNIQLATVLNEHSTHIMRQLVFAESGLVQNPMNGQPFPPEGGNGNDAA